MSALHCRQQSVCTYSIMPLEIPSAHPSNNRWVRIVLSFVRDLQIWYHRLCRPIGDLWCEGLWEKVGDNWKKIMFSDPLSGNSCQPLAAIAILYDLGRCTTFFFCIAATTLIDPNLTNLTTLSTLTHSFFILPTGPPDLSARPVVSFTLLWFWSCIAVCRRALLGSILERAKTAWNGR